MKYRWLVLGFILMMLWGCEAPAEPGTLPATEPEGTVAATEATVPSGLYLPESDVELATEGALKIFPLGDIDARGIRFLGDDILVFSGDDPTVLTLLSGVDRYMSAQKAFDCAISCDNPGVSVTKEGVTFYDASAGELVVLDKTLEQTKRIPIPDQPAAVALDRNLAYYCTFDALRVLDLGEGLDRLLKQMSFPHQVLTGIHQGGTVLQCTARNADGQSQDLFFSSDDGRLLYETSEPLFLRTCENFYFALHFDGNYQELLSGSSHFGPSVLVTDHQKPWIEAVSGSHSVVLAMPNADGQSTTLDYYDLESGHHPYQLTVPGRLQPRSIHADPNENMLWFVYRDTQRSDVLCCWNLTQSETDDPWSYLQPCRSMDSPDLEGLQRCQTEADAISEKHGVRILLWQDAVSAPPCDYTLVPEYQVPLIESSLHQLDQLLSRYPEDFLKEAASRTGNGLLTVCLVRAIEAPPGSGADAHSGALQYWDDQANAWLAVAAGDSMEQALYHGLFHFLESHVLSSSSCWDSWQELNPGDFEYDSDYATSISRDDWALISGEHRAFTDFFAMSYPREDRARIMEYAMLPGQADCFSSEIMYRKLRTLCLGIREAFSLDPGVAYPWEQYLSEPIAP